MIRLLLFLLLLSGVCSGQNISASRMPMSFGTIRQIAKPLKGNLETLSSSDSISYAQMICPNCGHSMSQIYADTVSIGGQEYKGIRILRCQMGNKVLLSYQVDMMRYWLEKELKTSKK